MATIRRCDQCGDLINGNHGVPVQVGQPHPMAMAMWMQGGDPPKNTQDFSQFEYCKECSMHLALALSQAKKAIKRVGAPVVRA